jgi:hypothetical protein
MRNHTHKKGHPKINYDRWWFILSISANTIHWVPTGGAVITRAILNIPNLKPGEGTFVRRKTLHAAAPDQNGAAGGTHRIPKFSRPFQAKSRRRVPDIDSVTQPGMPVPGPAGDAEQRAGCCWRGVPFPVGMIGRKMPGDARHGLGGKAVNVPGGLDNGK